MEPDTRGKNYAIVYASRTLNQAEANYSVTHQETLAIVWALKHFRDIITVFTDHVPVTEIFKGRNLTCRLARWYLTIPEFGPTFKYLPGRANVAADSLSKNILVGSVAEMPSQIENLTFYQTFLSVGLFRTQPYFRILSYRSCTSSGPTEEAMLLVICFSSVG